MAFVAPAIIDAFGHEVPSEEREHQITETIRQTSAAEPNEDALFMVTGHSGGYDPKSGRTPMAANACIGSYAHEAVHTLPERFTQNDLLAGNAVSAYIEGFRNNPAKADIDNSIQKHFRPLTASERMARCGVNPLAVEKKFALAGRYLGMEAARFEREVKLRGSGLFLIKLASEGMSLDEAKAAVIGRLRPRVREWGKKHGRKWTKMVRRDAKEEAIIGEGPIAKPIRFERDL